MGLECYVDADFAGAWTPETAHDANKVISRTGFVIMYANCPIHWASRLQTEIALSTAEAEYIALSSALREVIPLMTLMQELHLVFPVHFKKPNFHCKVHEDNQSCIKMAQSDKFTPRTKHIALKYHHFRRYVKRGEISILYCPTDEQKADILTKPPDNFFFNYDICSVVGNWTSRGGINSFLFVRKDWNPSSLLSGLFFCSMTISNSN
jgi:hypothetical protein